MARYRYGRTYDDKNIGSTRIAMVEVDDLISDFGDLLSRRLQLVVLKESLPQIYKGAITAEIEAAFETISANTFWKHAHNKASRHISVLCIRHLEPGEPLVFPNGEVKALAEVYQNGMLEVGRGLYGLPAVYRQGRDCRYITSEHPAWASLVEYARFMAEIRKQNRTALSYIRELLNTCNTWGQVVRIWPAFTTYIIHEGKRNKVQGQQKVSPYPEYYQCSTNLKEVNNRLLFVEQMLTQAILLPEFNEDNWFREHPKGEYHGEVEV